MITKRQLYKQLKREKLFSKYCLAIAAAFKQEPPSSKDDYEKGWLTERWTNVHEINDWFFIEHDHIAVQQP